MRQRERDVDIAPRLAPGGMYIRNRASPSTRREANVNRE